MRKSVLQGQCMGRGRGERERGEVEGQRGRGEEKETHTYIHIYIQNIHTCIHTYRICSRSCKGRRACGQQEALLALSSRLT